MLKRPLWVALAGLLAGCASYPDVPDAIRNPPPGDAPLPTEVSGEPETYEGVRVRWGGTVLEVRNQAQDSWVEVLAHPLERAGRPNTTAEAQGRFYGRVAEFLDPAIYAPGREVTITGTLGESVVQKIGEHEYRYPVVDAATHHLWPQRDLRRDRYGRYYYPSYPYDARFGFFYYRPHHLGLGFRHHYH